MNKTLKVIALISLIVSNAGYAQDYDKGEKAGMKGDYATTLREWRPLAEQGDAMAQIGLGFMYDNGRGVTQDYKEAEKWFRLAAEQGNMSGQLLLGQMFEKGHGVVQDNVYAYMWYTISDMEQAAKLKSFGSSPDKSEGLSDRIAKIMTASQIEEAQELARECVKKNYKGC